MAPVRYSLHYETYSDHIMSSFGKLLQTQSLVDMTLMCSTHTIRVHKAVLSASSVYFQEILQKQPGEPLIILKMKFGVLKCLVEFMYCGKTQCLEENMDELVAAAQFLKIKGLSKVTRESLGITNKAGLPVFTPPVVINRPPQSIIDLHAKDNSNTKSQPAQSSVAVAENPKKDTVVRIPFDIESGGNSNIDFTDPAQYVRPRRGRPSLRRSASNTACDSNIEMERATERALLRREQDSRNAIHQLKNLQSQNIQDYMDRLTLSHAVNSICDPEASKNNFINIDNDLMYMNQTTSSDVLHPSIPYTKGILSNTETVTATFSASSKVDVATGGSINNAMSQYVNALKNAGLPTDLPILFEAGDGSYINMNEQVLLDMVQSSEIQYEVIEQPNIMEKVSDLNEIKSIDDLSKSIERGEMLMDTKTFNETTNFCKENERDTINVLNEILPDNLDEFNDQTNYDTLESNLSNINSIQSDNNNDLSCIDNDLHFFTKSMSDDVKKYYVEPHLNDARDLEQYCPVSTTLDTSFSMSLLDTKSMHLGDPINEAYPADLSRNDDCFNLEHRLPNPNDFKDETLDFLISTPKEINSETNYIDDKQAQERNEIINDLINIEMNINNKDKSDALNMIPVEQYDMSDDIDTVKSNEQAVKSTVYLTNYETLNNKQETTTGTFGYTESKSYQDSFEDSIKAHVLDKNETKCKKIVTCQDINEKDNIEVIGNENIPFAVGLLPLQRTTMKEDESGSNKRKNEDSDYMYDIDAMCLKRKMKHKKK